MDSDFLLRYLDDEVAVSNTLANVSHTNVSKENRDRLKKLYIHICCQGVDPTSKSRRLKDSTSGSRARQKTSPETHRFKSLRPLVLPPPIQKYIHDWGNDPRHFMDCAMLVHGATAWPDNAGDTFIHCYQYTKQLISEEVPRNVRYHFQMLNYYDMCQLVMTTKTMGHNQVVAIDTFLNKLNISKSGITVKTAVADVVKWWKVGSKVDILCKVFGPGCLFFLSKELSENFLETKLRAKGPHYEELIHHLRHTLCIEKAMAESGADALGRNLRAHLLRPYQIAAAQQM